MSPLPPRLWSPLLHTCQGCGMSWVNNATDQSDKDSRCTCTPTPGRPTVWSVRNLDGFVADARADAAYRRQATRLLRRIRDHLAAMRVPT